jgi:hypothetical protein
LGATSQWFSKHSHVDGCRLSDLQARYFEQELAVLRGAKSGFFPPAKPILKTDLCLAGDCRKLPDKSLHDQIKEDEIGGVCGTCGGGVKCVQGCDTEK